MDQPLASQDVEATTMERPEDDPSDQSLLSRFKRGQADASTRLYLRYAGRLHALAARQSGADLARRVDPEDIVQSVFRTFFRRASQGEYVVPDGEEIWKLLLVIALNKVRAAAAHHRAAKRDVGRTAGGDALDHAAGAESGRDETGLAILRMVVDEALAQLPEAQRQMIELRIEGHEVEEIARQTGRSKRSVERVLQEFRKHLGGLIREGD
jgi:RNA polymerase sigma-70 factor (ECF subfamily)